MQTKKLADENVAKWLMTGYIAMKEKVGGRVPNLDKLTTNQRTFPLWGREIVTTGGEERA